MIIPISLTNEETESENKITQCSLRSQVFKLLVGDSLYYFWDAKIIFQLSHPMPRGRYS